MKKQSSESKIEESDKIFLEKLDEIRSVAEWAAAMGFRNAKYFSKRYRNHFGIRPKHAMVKYRLQKAKNLLMVKPEKSCYEVARAIGIKDEKELNRYFRRHADTTPSLYKEKEERKKGSKRG